MSISVTHNFVSAVGDDAIAEAAGEVLPSHWNEAHVVSGAATAEQGALADSALQAFESDFFTFSKDTGKGIRVDTTTPTFGWHDIIGLLLPDQQGANAPTLAAFIGGNVRRFAFSATDKADCEFHIPHDYAAGTDLYIHAHWSHNGTAISGNLVLSFSSTYAKGHNQAAFGAEKTVTLTYATVDIATTPRYQHRIDEVQLSTSGGSATLLDTDLLEPDGVIGVNLTATTIPTITGGAPNEPFIFFVDVHYQSTGIPTKQRAPDFYV